MLTGHRKSKCQYNSILGNYLGGGEREKRMNERKRRENVETGGL